MWTPQSGIQFHVVVNWKVAPAGSYAHHMPSESTNSTTKIPNGR